MINETLIPKVGVVTDIRKDTPDVKTFRVVGTDGKKLLYLGVATIPAGVVGLMFSNVIDGMFLNVKMLAWTFFATALMLILCHFIKF